MNPNYKPKVTIIVPTYNEAKLIWKTRQLSKITLP